MSSSNLPPSTEEAYRKKCIALRRRMQEVEENNDAVRLRRARLIRGIRKMRIERALLLDSLAKRMRKNGAAGTIFDEDSEDSNESPPTPQERPLRVKKPHRRLPDMSSPPPESTTQPSNGYIAQTNPSPTKEKDTDALIVLAGGYGSYSRRDLLPSSELLQRISPTSVIDLFRIHLMKLVPTFGVDLTASAQEAEAARGFFDTLPEDVKQEWVRAEQTIKANSDRAKAAEDWKKTAASNRSKSIGNKPIELDDDDIVMVDPQDVKR